MESADNTNKENKQKQRKGFAVLDPEKRKEMARIGGKLAHAMGKAHKFTPEEARLAGQKGGRGRKQQEAEEAGDESAGATFD